MSSIQNPTAIETETQKQEEVPVTNNAMEVDSKVSEHDSFSHTTNELCEETSGREG